MNDRVLKQLAGMSISDGQVNESVSAYVLTKLAKSDMKRYLMYLRNVIRDGRVLVSTPVVPDAGDKERLAALFAGKDIRFAADPALGAGLQIEYGDNVLNMNIRTMIEQTIGQKQKL